MRSAGQLSGLAVVSEAGGERLGRVHDVLFSPEEGGRIAGFVVHPGGLFAKPLVLPRLFVRSLGSDAFLVEGGKVLDEVAGEPVIAGSLSARGLDDRPVLDDSGKFLGKLDDVLVDEQNLTVVALLLNTGMIDTVLHGKPRVPLSTVKTIGPDSIVVPAEYDPAAAEKYR